MGSLPFYFIGKFEVPDCDTLSLFALFLSTV